LVLCLLHDGPTLLPVLALTAKTEMMCKSVLLRQHPLPMIFIECRQINVQLDHLSGTKAKGATLTAGPTSVIFGIATLLSMKWQSK
jgi:hypothetical protein